METEVLGNIPRLYTALADWLACLLYLFFLPKRTAGWRRYTIHAVFLLLLLLEKNFSFTGPKTGRILAVYHTGLNLTVLMLAVRGILQVLGTPLSSSINAAISGVAGIGHILLGTGLVLLLLQIRRFMEK